MYSDSIQKVFSHLKIPFKWEICNKKVVPFDSKKWGHSESKINSKQITTYASLHRTISREHDGQAFRCKAVFLSSKQF